MQQRKKSRAGSKRSLRQGRGRSETPRPRLKKLELEFEPRLTAAFTEHGKQLWVYYFPFLYCYSRTSGRQILYTSYGGSHLLFLERESERGRQLDLVIPPIPFSGEAVEFARDLIASRRRPRPGRILWVDEQDGAGLRDWGAEVLAKEEEYIIEPKRILGPDAGLPRRLRRKLKKAEEEPLDFVPFGPEHRTAAHELLERLVQNAGEGPLLDIDYTQESISRARSLTERGMLAFAALHAGKLAGFAFGGRMTNEMANFFVLKTDPEVPGLAEWLRFQFLRELADYRYVNDAGDLGKPGLAQHKRQFMPVRMLQAYTVRRLT